MITLIAITSTLVALLALVVAIRSSTVLLHELGHAIPAILFTKARVTVFLGSYGDSRKCFRIRVGLLDIWMKYMPLWNIGMCVLSDTGVTTITTNKKIIYTLAGPAMSLLVAAVTFVFVYFFELHIAVHIALILLMASAIIDFIYNIVPKNALIKLHNGEYVYNDGYQLKQLLYLKKIPDQIEVAVQLLNDKKYQEAAKKFDYILSNNLEGEDFYRLAIFSFIQANEYEKALTLHKSLALKYSLNADDYNKSGLIKSYLDLAQESISDYDKSLCLDPKNQYALNNKGYQLNLLEGYNEAIILFDKAIETDPTFAYSYNNRGLAKIKIGKIDEGLKDIEHSLQLDPNNAYAFKNLGVYHLDKNEITQASVCFDKAKKLDPNTHGINKLIEEVSRKKRYKQLFNPLLIIDSMFKLNAYLGTKYRSLLFNISI